MNTGERMETSGAPAVGGKVRLYELAKELGIANKELVERVRSLGIDVKNHMSNLDTDDVTWVKRSLEKDRTATARTKDRSSALL